MSWWDLSSSSFVSWLETIRIRLTMCGGVRPPGGADVCNDGYHYDMLTYLGSLHEI